jgi:L,D-transpeptidase YbiS
MAEGMDAYHWKNRFRVSTGRTLAVAWLMVGPFAAKDCQKQAGREANGLASAGPAAASETAVAGENLPGLQADVSALRKQNQQLRERLDKLLPRDPYIVINTTLNRLYLRRGSETIVDAVCSTGSNTQLVEPNGKRHWFFSTPRGVFSVKNKMIAPVWVKPDWAFIEEGEPVPGAQAEERFQEGFLGKYGLYFGNGYLIHGTLFQRFLGQSVTHGCVRLGDADLERVYQNSKVGTKIYIY